MHWDLLPDFSCFGELEMILESRTKTTFTCYSPICDLWTRTPGFLRPISVSFLIRMYLRNITVKLARLGFLRYDFESYHWSRGSLANERWDGIYGGNNKRYKHTTGKSPKIAQKNNHSIGICSIFLVGMVYFGWYLVNSHVQGVQNMYGKKG